MTLIPGWDNAAIKAALERKGWSLRQLSISKGYGHSAAQTALHRPYPKMEKIISEAIDVPASDIWPGRYNSEGEPNRKKGRPAKKPGV